MSIIALSIRNFRSIANLDLTTTDLNILVGQNDDGKSNVLRALDLFFNDGKGYEFDWKRDYCSYVAKKKQKAEQIVIELTFQLPQSFAKKVPVIWSKTWRQDGLNYESQKHKDKTKFDGKSKIPAFLRAIRYEYVPAIKGENYFQALMSNLHDMLEATVEKEVREASGVFTTAINENTKSILEEIEKRLGLKTTIQLPASLRDLFAQLVFTSISNDKAFSLNQRGDGIKVRHIPIVLRWLAQQANHLSAPGRPKKITIWGYEEPENNLELRRCFDMAKEFVEGASEIQTFATTHSPAFYSVFRDSDPQKVSLFLVTKPDGQSVSSVKPLTNGDMVSLDGSMGLLFLLEPHFKEAAEELKTLRASIKNLTDTNIPTIFCEGPTDKMFFETALQLFFPAVATKVNVKCSTHHGGGHTWVGEMLMAWSYSRPLAKAVGIFDKDPDAQRTLKETSQKVNNPPSGKKAFSVSLIPGSELKTCFTRGISVPFGPEELLPESIWDFAEKEEWLEERTNPVGLYKFDQRDRTFDDYFKELLPEPHLYRIALNKVRLEDKEKLSKHVCTIVDIEVRKRTLHFFRPPLEQSLKQLDVL